MSIKHKLTSIRMLLLTMLVIVTCGSVSAQTVTGKVTSSRDGAALAGATVLVQGTNTGAFTDENGEYTVNVSGDGVLIFRYVGHETLEEAVNGRSTINVTLQASEKTLDEVVVTGYGTQKAKEVTSAITSVKAEDFNGGNVNDPSQLLQGKVAGLAISRPGGNPNGGFNIRLRGLSTVGANTQPLIIIDGVPGADLSTVDPQDIASVDVLKDGSASAIYGTRGASGVILITTKKGIAGNANIDYNGYAAFESIDRVVDVLTADEYRNFGGGTDLGESTDWFDEITRTGLSNVHNVSLSGGTAQTSYRVSLNYRNIQGVAINTGFDQLNGRINLSQKALNDKLTIDLNLASTQRNSDFGFDQAFRYATIYNPTAPVRSTDPEFDQYDGYFQQVLFDYYNPVAILEQNTNEAKRKQIIANIRGTYELAEGLNFSMFYSQQRQNTIGGVYWDKNSFLTGADRNGLATRRSDDQFFQLFESTLNYNNTFGALNLDLLAGYSYQDFLNEGFGATGGDFLTDAFQFNSLGDAGDFNNGLGSVFSYKNSEKLIAFFGRVQGNIDDTYYFSASLRREGSSRFGTENQWGLFPGISAGVVLSNLFTVEGLDFMKLRAGYGVTGNRPNQSYISLLSFGQVGNFFFNGEFVPSYGPTGTNVNPDLKWETKSDISVGLDFSMMGYRLNGTIDFYQTTTNDLILPFTVPVPPNLTNTTIVNIGELTNSGLEFSLTYDAVDNDGFKWTPGINGTYYLGTNLVSLSNEDFNFGGFRLISNLGSPGQNNTPLVRVEEGASLGQLWGLTYEGINDDGTWRFTDLNGDGQINDEDESVIGNGLPVFQLGFNNTFQFGNFDLNFFFRGVFGHEMVNTFRAFYEAPSTISSYNILATSSDIAELTDSPRFSSLHVEDASFLKLDNATLGYTIPLAGDASFRKIRLYVAGQNLLTFTGYTGVDPEVRFQDGADPLAPGIDRRNTYFRSRTITVGVNLGLQ
ncbi:MAG: SusC/RagA family TonB-linked outer membrane protein [Bacteroidota bacterium]